MKKLLLVAFMFAFGFSLQACNITELVPQKKVVVKKCVNDENDVIKNECDLYDGSIRKKFQWI